MYLFKELPMDIQDRVGEFPGPHGLQSQETFAIFLSFSQRPFGFYEGTVMFMWESAALRLSRKGANVFW